MDSSRKTRFFEVTTVVLILILLTCILGESVAIYRRGQEKLKGSTPDRAISIKWTKDNNNEGMKKYDEKYIKIRGYFSSTGDEENNMYYVSCIPQNQRMFQLSKQGAYSVIAVNFSKGTKVEFYEGLIEVIGKVEFATYGIDIMGYSYDYKIVNATYKEVDSKDIKSESAKKYDEWIKAEDSELGKMYKCIEKLSDTVYWKDSGSESCEKIDTKDIEEIKSRIEKGDKYDKEFVGVAEDILNATKEVNKLIDEKVLTKVESSEDVRLADIEMKLEKVYLKYLYCFEVINESNGGITYDTFDVDKYVEEIMKDYEEIAEEEEEEEEENSEVSKDSTNSKESEDKSSDESNTEGKEDKE